MPIDERQFIAEVESADAVRLQALLARPSPEQERALRTYLGDPRYQRMRSLALQGSRSRAAPGGRGNVMVLHGIMGGQLGLLESERRTTSIWVSVLRLLGGAFQRLGLDPQGKSLERIEATGILKRYYGEQLLALQSSGWRTHAFWYDWRLDIRQSAKLLARRIEECFGDEPVHLVAHSMGGLVCRAFIQDNEATWQRWWRQGGGARGGRLVMLGTPNHGSFCIPQLLTGLNELLRALALVDLSSSRRDLLQVATTFDGVFQMLPSPLELPEAAALYDPRLYDVPIPPRRFELGRTFHQRLAEVVDRERMIYIAGSGRPTPVGLSSYDREAVRTLERYQVSGAGDGTVPHRLGLLREPGGAEIDAYYVRADHQDLPVNGQVLAAMDELLTTGKTARLARAPLERGLTRGDRGAAQALVQERQRYEAEVSERRQRLRVARALGEPPESTSPLAADEAALLDLLVRGPAALEGEDGPASRERPPAGGTVVALPLPEATGARLRLQFLEANIGEVGLEVVPTNAPPVDALAVGHYIGVRPVAAEQALDVALSGGPDVPDEQRLLTSFTERRIIRGELGQPFFLVDPRLPPAPRGGGRGDTPRRLVAVAGMGHPGRFGAPELVLLVRELLWSLGRLGRRHLASVLIGSGAGNLSVERAAKAWLEGASSALTEIEADADGGVQVVTIVDNDPEKLLRVEEAFASQAEDAVLPGLEVVRFTARERSELRARAARRARQRAAAASARQRPAAGNAAEEGRHPTRITMDLQGDQYRFGALTRDASLPERIVAVDPKLVEQFNQALVEADTVDLQKRRGELLYRLVFPGELQASLSGPEPLVVSCDATVARIHWEMLARPPGAAAPDRAGASGARFLFLERSLSRQLRTAFAPPPEPTPSRNRVLRALIVGDTDVDRPLLGAQEEALRVTQHLEALRATGRVAVEIRSLVGPGEATRARVLEELMMTRYDLFHFAGHCVYDEKQRTRSGLLFSGDERLGANELGRVDRAPALVVCNACESGITPDRSDRGNPGMAPSFAESFFARGVQNFLCTGWPVDDQAALMFADVFYRRLLGLPADPVDTTARAAAPPVSPPAPAPIHLAVLAARQAVFAMADGRGLRTWGAYQHYGDPDFSLLPGVELPAEVIALRRRPGPVRTKGGVRAARLRRRPSPGKRSAPR